MSDDNTEEVEMTETEQVDVEAGEVEDAVEDPTEGLKKALAAARKDAKDERRLRTAAERQLADKDRPADELAIEAAKREARDAVLGEANARIVRAEVKGALAGKVTDLALALAVIDTADIDVSEDGDVDPASVESAISALIEKHPSLAAKRFGSGADQGAKGRQSVAAQVTQQELENMTPEQVVQARKDGRLNKLLGVSS